jgi:hypothetical protein
MVCRGLPGKKLLWVLHGVLSGVGWSRSCRGADTEGQLHQATLGLGRGVVATGVASASQVYGFQPLVLVIKGFSKNDLW